MPPVTSDLKRVVARLFGVDSEDVRVDTHMLRVRGQTFPIDRGVILLDQTDVQYQALPGTKEDVRRSFSHEWDTYRESLPEHDSEFLGYFDVVQLDYLRDKIGIDLGCGAGRWSLRLAEYCDAIVLVDFSDAIFVAAENLAAVPKALFFRGDITQLPFVNESADFIFSLGDLHHLEEPCLKAVRPPDEIGTRRTLLSLLRTGQQAEILWIDSQGRDSSPGVCSANSV